MSGEQCKYYGFGYSGCNFLSINRSVYTQSELVSGGVNNKTRMIECNKEEKWMIVREKLSNSIEWNEIDLIGLKEGVSIDLGDDKGRWEGNSLNGSPFGYGCIYNSENQLIYSGFIFEGLKVCYGIEMYGDVGLVEYEGGYYKDMRFGNGKLYSKKNELIYEGDWYNNDILEISSVNIERELKEEDLHFGLEEIVLDGCMDNIKKFILFGYSNLKKLVIKNSHFDAMKYFSIENCDDLIEVKLEGESESDTTDEQYIDDSQDNINETSFTTSNRVFQISNCKHLQSLIIGTNWYQDNTNTVLCGIIKLIIKILF